MGKMYLEYIPYTCLTGNLLGFENSNIVIFPSFFNTLLISLNQQPDFQNF